MPVRPVTPGRGVPTPFVVGHGGDSAAAYLAIVLHFVAILVIVAAAVYIVLRILRHRAAGRIVLPPRSAGVDELDLRYARGEIERAEYVTRRADLLGLTYAPPPPGAGPPPG